MEKENFGIKLNALKYKNAGVASLKGSTATKKCLVIPIEDNNLFVSVNTDGTPKAVYLDLSAFALREPKYGPNTPCKAVVAKGGARKNE